MPSLTDKLDEFPPCLVRLVARDPQHPGRRLSLTAIADKSGLSYGATNRIAVKRSWASVQPWMIDAFCSACGVEILRPAKRLAYLRRVLSDPNGYKLLATKSGRGSPANLLKLLRTLS